ncbi:conserved hypothetical protein ['Nostoc azollae' 0708]|jgi:hypothetical protein|uniref:Uncharacterized protein n=1 Tax=Nostoc azollae (strain 0708) TaxID=551115 RepID=D7DXD8_NOSA0|nr:conserved hypothetical protein ['Nostoc azollae' 0708]
MIFDVETSITKGLYINMGEIGRNLIDELRIDTNNLQIFEPGYIHKNPRMLPIFRG